MRRGAYLRSPRRRDWRASRSRRRARRSSSRIPRPRRRRRCCCRRAPCPAAGGSSRGCRRPGARRDRTRRAGADSLRSAGPALLQLQRERFGKAPSGRKGSWRSRRRRPRYGRTPSSRARSGSPPRRARAQLGEHALVVGGIDEHRDRGIVLRRGAQHRGTADVDVFDRRFERAVRDLRPWPRTDRGSPRRGRWARCRRRGSPACGPDCRGARAGRRGSWDAGSTRPSSISAKPV